MTLLITVKRWDGPTGKSSLNNKIIIENLKKLKMEIK